MGDKNRWKLDSIEACMSWMGIIYRVILELPLELSHTKLQYLDFGFGLEKFFDED